ncbi:8-amino-7-oxononanoate synthase [Streptomyces alfalfae]|uniref:8-amino-7-oxononanoate synthase n=1 Tax=Streptomyces alfalfae TaxID=1642299 RepID=A0A1P8TJU8_9ACTN|nr:aminotransferase class I/II-fold pyridoxal phosphate-dependent enzyme [Streptomyces alfalfae]AYA18289.1 aminotransferase class I/II-fold pyridoxal phosphate-dependent enzyme [Streptomyces fradiae]APY87913.1 8-amino-7-oxononanoate synthase [Streptomyces alfalfae]QQC89689.1 aminotransferase class I/II-fold pyridoxal phosphate-dependent enzyme [Streptomyces alfalfae]QUI32129.1 aminotransferase class I/II-fold pyridoxal phosphate-dependent enzyme [Streptomyces alfalfae]RXX45441.1 8-amino-7-oxon
MNEPAQTSKDPSLIHRQVVEIVASRTLYDTARLRPESDLEGELGIDSVVLESILVALTEHFGLPRELDSAPETLRDLVADVTAALAAAHGPADGTPELLETLVGTAMRHTHYQRHQLGLDADFESELGIDSVVLTSIIADTADAVGIPQDATDGVQATTLRKLHAELAALQPLDGGADGAPAADRAAAGTGADDWDSRSMKDFMEERDTDLFAKARSFRAYRTRREQDRLYWYGMPHRARSGSRAVMYDDLEGREREFLMFASNNYLGLAEHPKVVEAVCDATRAFGATHTGSRIIGGTNELHRELERRLARLKGREACAVFPGGYSANLGVISGLVKSYDAAIVDRLNHMSIVDGCKLSGAVRKIYRHNDMADLERVLQRCRGEVMGRLIVADGVFSMHGDICDLPEIVRLAREYDARVLIDDAHATGVLGEHGTGTAEHFGLKGQVDLELGTMSKALAGMGGFVVGDQDVIDYLRFYANSYVFAANIPPGTAAGLIASIDVMESEPQRLTRLWDNIRTLRSALLDAGFDLERSESAILPIVIGDERTAMEMGRAVRARGLFCQTVVFPGVPLGDARLRISVTSEHTPADLQEAAGIFAEAGRETGVLPRSER